jgi:hypothetical protein
MATRPWPPYGARMTDDGRPAPGSWPNPPGLHPQEREARRRAVAAGLVQLASPFVFAGTVFAGLVVEIPTADPHGYGQIFGFFGAMLLMLPALILTATAVTMLRNARRAGAVLLLIGSAVAAVQSLGLATGIPGGITELTTARWLTIVVGVIWLAVSVLCAVVAAWARPRLRRRTDGAPLPTPA